MKNKEKGIDIIFWIALATSTFFLVFFRLRMGYATLDEAGYIEFAHRLLQGDAMLVEEWHRTQLASILLAPFVWAFERLAGSFEGVVLTFRFIYLIVHVAFSAFSYVLWRKKGKLFAALSSLMFFLYTPFCLYALNYNTFALNFLYLSIALWINKSDEVWANVLTGFLYAGAVLCNPYLIVIYFVYFVYSIALLFKKNRTHFKCFGEMTCGAAVLLCVFLGVVFSRASLSEVINNLPNVLEDSAHPYKNVFGIMRVFVDFMLDVKYFSAVFAICFFIGLIFKKTRGAMLSVIMIACCACGVYLGFFKSLWFEIGCTTMIIPASLAGFSAFIFDKNRNYRMFVGFCVGMVYAICLTISSNTGIMSPANAFALTSALSVFFILAYLENNGKTAVKIAFSVFLAVTFVTELNVCYNCIFLEEPRNEIVFEIDRGPSKGLIVSKDKYESYVQNLENIGTIDLADAERVMYYRNSIFLYLATPDLKVGAPSAWQKDCFALLDDYLTERYFYYHSEMIPDVIYIDEMSVEWDDETISDYADRNGYGLKSFSNGARALIKKQSTEALVEVKPVKRDISLTHISPLNYCLYDSTYLVDSGYICISEEKECLKFATYDFEGHMKGSNLVNLLKGGYAYTLLPYEDVTLSVICADEEGNAFLTLYNSDAKQIFRDNFVLPEDTDGYLFTRITEDGKIVVYKPSDEMPVKEYCDVLPYHTEKVKEADYFVISNKDGYFDIVDSENNVCVEGFAEGVEAITYEGTGIFEIVSKDGESSYWLIR